VVAEGAVGTPLLAVTAKDLGQRETGLAGVTFGVALGLGVTFE
jgi:hypothetical protein